MNFGYVTENGVNSNVVISYNITKKLHIYGMNTIHMQSYHRLDKYKIENLAGLY